ncbi:signal peptidase II [Thiohalorhabdus methylotrophus]|uniref:Lipoprotein signal peptidase n=1 Tax=Thiohalorhabdus methylotrophus TaxID=3242694 RepID=A0ABV4TWY6_9GAMM
MAWPWVLAAVIVVIDQVTKNLVQAALAPGEGIILIPDFLNLVHAHNRGVAFGMLDGAGGWQVPLLAVVTFGVIIALGVWLFRLGRSEWGTRLALGLILGGAVGNLIDRVWLGYVVDFVDVHWKSVYHYPAFNVADSGITLGAMVLVGVLIREELAVRRDRAR